MTRWYCAIVHKDGGSAFGVTFPDLPGCFSAADCEADIVPNAMEALALWFSLVDHDYRDEYFTPCFISKPFLHFFYDSDKYAAYKSKLQSYRLDRQLDRREQIFFVRTFGAFLDDDNPNFILRKFNGRESKATVRLLDTG